MLLKPFNKKGRMPERDLIKYLLSKDTYLLYKESLPLNNLKDNYKDLYYVYQALIELHEKQPEDLSLDELEAYFSFKYPDADRELYRALFQSVRDTKVSEGVASLILQEMRNKQSAMKLSEAAFKFASGIGDVESVKKAFSKFESPEDDTEDFEFVTTDLKVLLQDTVRRRGLRWRLDFLNKSLGSLRKGDFGFLFARPETGKTTFLASEISWMLDQLSEDAGPIIWFNNEEAGNKVMVRLYQAYFGATLPQVLANTAKFDAEFNDRTNGKFLLADDAGMSKAKVERIVKKHRPSLIVYDQIDKIKGFAADREDLRLGSIYIWARELAKEWCPSIGVCQADVSGENQKWLTMDNVANAKTSKQAEADWILGIGAIHDMSASTLRYLNISKNKLSGDEDTLPSLRHGRSEVLILPEIARYQDIKGRTYK